MNTHACACEACVWLHVCVDFMWVRWMSVGPTSLDKPHRARRRSAVSGYGTHDLVDIDNVLGLFLCVVLCVVCCLRVLPVVCCVCM